MLMNKKQILRPIVDEIALMAQEEGMDLFTDSLTLKFSYPDMPGIEVTFTVGGIFSGMDFVGDEQ